MVPSEIYWVVLYSVSQLCVKIYRALCPDGQTQSSLVVMLMVISIKQKISSSIDLENWS